MVKIFRQLSCCAGWVLLWASRCICCQCQACCSNLGRLCWVSRNLLSVFAARCRWTLARLTSCSGGHHRLVLMRRCGVQRRTFWPLRMVLMFNLYVSVNVGVLYLRFGWFYLLGGGNEAVI